MNTGFVEQPPHPESEWSSCTGHSAEKRDIEPVLQLPLRDASICRGADEMYYLTGTAGFHGGGAFNQGISMWRSPNLADWEPIGLVWSLEQHGTWQKELSQVPSDDGLTYDRAIVSPEVHYIQGTFWITYAINWGGTGLLKSLNGSAEGPYVDIGRITVDGTDASLFEDKDGQVYWVYGDGKVARMNGDMTGLAEEPRRAVIPASRFGFRSDKLTLTKDDRLGTHGAFMTRIGDFYFLFCAESFDRMGSDGIDTFVAVGSSPYGPFSRRYLAIPHGGQATIFRGADGQPFAAFSGRGAYSLVQDMPAIVPMRLPEPDFIRPPEHIRLEKGAVARLQPVADIPIRDTHMYYAPDGLYYMTGTSNKPNDDFWQGNDELHLWSSPDLKQWKHIGCVWDFHVHGTWQNAIYDKPCLWAPEICYFRGTFWLTYSMKGGSTALLKSTTGRAEGPYVDMGRMTNTDIDSSLFADDDGSVYYVWQDGKIARMKQNMSGFAEDYRKLLTPSGITVGYEGAFIVKYQGKYILGAAECHGDERVDGTYDLMYAWADHIYGPYSERKVAVPHGGHGTMFIDREGRLMSTLFGNDRTAPFRARPGVVALTVVIDKSGEVHISPAEEQGGDPFDRFI